MCTELFLALIYFSVIFGVNFFIYKLLKTYIKNVTYLLKLKNILNSFSGNELDLILLLHKYLKKEFQNKNLLTKINSLEDTSDVLIIGNLYKNLLKNRENVKIKRNRDLFYLKLLENQYLAKNESSTG